MLRSPGGRTIVLAALIALVLGCASSAQGYVFFPETYVRSSELDGSNLTNVNGPQSAAGGVASDGNWVYYAVSPGLGPAPSIARVQPDGSALNASFVTLPKPSCSALSLEPDAAAIAVDGSHVYWLDDLHGTIGRANLSDGSGVVAELVKTAGGACGTVSENGPSPAGLALDGAHIYWTNPGQNSIGRANLDGGEATQSFITGAHVPWGIAVSGSDVYWTNTETGTIGHAKLDGSGAVIPASVNQSFIGGLTGFSLVPLELATFAGALYFDNGDGWIGRSNLEGTSVERHVIHAYEPEHGGAGPSALAIDARHAAPVKVEVACTPSSLQVLHPVATDKEAFVSVRDMAKCTFTVRDAGQAPTTPTGTITPSSNPDEGFFLDASCTLAATATPGASSCTISYATTDNLQYAPEFVPNATHTTISAVYSGETTHTPNTGGVEMPLQPVHFCDPAAGPEGFGYRHVCDLAGHIADSRSSGPKAPGTTTMRTTSVSLGAGAELRLSVPVGCVTSGKTMTAKLALSAHARQKLKRAVFQIGKGHRTSLTRAPFSAHVKVPKAKHAAALRLVVHVTLVHGKHHVAKTLALSLRAC
jgi:hypothetical protein